MTGRLECPVSGLPWRFQALRLRPPMDADDFGMICHLAPDIDARFAHVTAVLLDARAWGYDHAIAACWDRLDVDPERWERAS